MNVKNVSFTNLSLHIKFCRYCRHDKNWSERKTNPRNTLTMVAEQLGFTDSYTFSKAFKRYYG